MSKSGLLFTIVGPTAVGKSALMNDALEHFAQLRQMPTMTTRPQRPGETHGRERIFVSPADFQRQIAENALLEWQEVYKNRFYGVPHKALDEALERGDSLIADIDVLGATYIRSVYPDNAYIIFVRPPSVNVLPDRMRTRGDEHSEIQGRLPRVEMEMAYVPVADYVVVNDEFERTSAHFRSIIAKVHAEKDTTQRHFSHTVATIPIYQNEVFVRQQLPHYPEVDLLPGEIPHDAALRSLSSSFNIETAANHLLRIKATRGSFISPVQIQAEDDGPVKHIHLTYIYLLPERIQAPKGWTWHPAEEMELPDIAREILREMS